MRFELIKEDNINPKCPDCFRGRLFYIKEKRIWKCCKEGGGFMWCLREYKGKQ